MRLIEEHRGQGAVVVPVTVAVEVDHLLRTRVDSRAARRFLGDLESGAFLSEPVDDDVLAESARIDREHADADIGLVDASVIAVAERLGADAILTLDHPHFRLVRELSCALRPEESELQCSEGV